MPDAPVQILPNQGAGTTPTAPVQVAANAGAGVTPTAPVQVAANAGAGVTPTAPVQVAANAGAGVTPTAPVQVAANAGAGSAPASPVQIAANAGGAGTPTPPAYVLPSAAGGGASLTYATGTLTVLGNSGDASVSILGYYFGLSVTTPDPGLSIAETYAKNLAEEINSLFEGAGFRPIAAVSGAVVTLTANLPGIAGNQIDIASSDANVVASGPYLTGGGGDPIISVTGTLTKNGTEPVVFPVLAVDQSRASAEAEYSSTGWDHNTGGPALTGWYYTGRIEAVMTGTFPALVLTGYRWRLRATRYSAGVQAEFARWTSAPQPTSHPIEAATGWTADSPATGTPAVTVPVLQGFAAPPVVAGAAAGGAPASPVQIVSNSGASTPAAPPAVI